MRVTICTVGTRGDVQPFLAIGVGLRRAGHAVRFAAPEPILRQVAPLLDEDVELAPLAHNLLDLVRSPELRAAARSGSPARLARALREVGEPLFERLLDESWRVCRGAEAILYSAQTMGAFDSAELLGVPAYYGAVAPLFPTRRFAHPIAPALPLGPTYNRLSFALMDQALWRLCRGPVNRWRQRMGLRPVPAGGMYPYLAERRVPMLFGYSPALAPRPADWPPQAQVTGFWFLERPRSWRPPARLEAFLEAGPPPVCVGFGSATDAKAEAAMAVAVAALRRTGQRGVLVSDVPRLRQADLPPSVMLTGSLPYDWLFPRVAAVVHQGGSGATGQCLRCGRPAVVVPFAVDQAFWGRRVAAQGAGPPPIPRARLSVERLAAAVDRVVHDGRLRRGAEAIGRLMRAEDGVGHVVRAFAEEARHVTVTAGAQGG